MTDTVPPDGYDDEGWDRPDVDDVQQAQEPRTPAVPVLVEGVARVDQLPTELGVCRNFLLPAGTAASGNLPIKILDRDPRRRMAAVWVNLGGDDVILAGTAGECAHGTGAILPTTNTVPLRLELGFMSELWAAARVDADPVGATLSVVTELWSR